MIDSNSTLAFLREEILHYYRWMYTLQKKALKIHKKGRGIVLHEYVKGLLFCYAKDKQWFTLPEYMPFDHTKHRIDVLWLDRRGTPLAAFEVDQTIYSKSIKKLSALDPSCQKFIVSIGAGAEPLPIHLLSQTSITSFDLTQTTLGVASYFPNTPQEQMF